MKAAAQLSTLKSERAQSTCRELEQTADALVTYFRQMAGEGAEIDRPAHELMIKHALLNACGHAWYVQADGAEDLLGEYLMWQG